MLETNFENISWYILGCLQCAKTHSLAGKFHIYKISAFFSVMVMFVLCFYKDITLYTVILNKSWVQMVMLYNIISCKENEGWSFYWPPVKSDSCYSVIVEHRGYHNPSTDWPSLPGENLIRKRHSSSITEWSCTECRCAPRVFCFVYGQLRCLNDTWNRQFPLHDYIIEMKVRQMLIKEYENDYKPCCCTLLSTENEPPWGNGNIWFWKPLIT